jgi:probable rRNA maturation factor
MSTLHRRYLQRAGPTDVLSFDFGSDRACGYLDAEIVVCADLARERTVHCRAALAAARAELALYVVHGILHLAGYDDHTPSTARRMHARERALLPELCVLVR